MANSDLGKKNQRGEPEQAARAANEVLSALDRWSRRIGNHFTQKRENPRSPYRELITLYIPGATSVVGEAEDKLAIQAWARNISRSGITFIYHELINEDQIVICLNSPGEKCISLDAEIVRRRQVQNGYWEYGARFSGRAVM